MSISSASLPRFLCGMAVVLAAALITQPLLAASQRIAAGILAVLVLLWILALWQDRSGFATPCFALLALLDIGFLTAGYTPSTLALLALVLLLGAWDLNHLSRKVAQLATGVDVEGYIQRHLYRLAMVLGAGFALGWISMRVRFTLPFPAMLILGIVCVALLYWVLGSTKKLGRGV